MDTLDRALEELRKNGNVFEKQGGVFQGSGASGPATYAPAKNRVPFEAVHKRRNVRFDLDIESRRQLKLEEIRKNLRSGIKRMMSAEKAIKALISGDSGSERSPTDSSHDSASSSAEPSASRKALDNHPRAKVTGSVKGVANWKLELHKTGKVGPLPSMSDYRRGCLERWGKEKESYEAVQRNPRQQFQAGLPPPAAPPKTGGTTGVAPTKPTAPSPFTSLISLVSVSRTEPATQGSPKSETRGVMTRAMPNGQPVSSTGLERALQKMKNLNISKENEAHTGTAKLAGVTATAPISKPDMTNKKLKSEFSHSTYMQFLSFYSSTRMKLRTCSNTWKNYVRDKKSSEIPEKIQSDIISAFEKVKRLTKSLELFRELLSCYFACYFLEGEGDRNPDLVASQLQRCVDVISIKIKAVEKIFAVLSTLRDNKWRESPSPPPPTTENGGLGEVTPRTDPSGRVPKPLKEERK